jgi:FkbM family methyltransferase
MRLHRNVHCSNYAAGMHAGRAAMAVGEFSDRSHLVEGSTAVTAAGAGEEMVNVITLDAFCADQKIDTVGLLKIDTEGSDLDVLRGGANILRDQRIDLVQLEAGMNFRNQLHVPFEQLKSFMESMGYFLFGIYEQVPEWPTRAPHLRRSNPLFISERVIRANT